MSTTAKIRIERACMAGGRAQPVGTELQLPLLEALQVVDCGKAVFMDPADRERAFDAQRKQNARLTHRTVNPGEQWQHVGRG